MDLGDRRSQAVVLDACGEVIDERGLATARAALERALLQAPDGMVCTAGC